ncbi:DUF1707 and DUF2154 domain-containing protein [Nocardiopsis sp. CNT-189]|uniref:DUF1707 SHOCT-like domain-containing protein n=1 Tax=Nocardiopsis oceanisediminis TaxID=2816862 RepID=UPI003B2CE3DC
MRASDADRERVAGVLREAAAAGRITLEELQERLDAAFAARTYDDLAPLTADLPAEPGPRAPAQRRAAAAPRPERERPLVLRAKVGNVVRRGHWTVPRRIQVSNPMGSTVLDFRSAELPDGPVDVDLATSWGETRLVLPDGATAEIRVNSSWFGLVDSRVPETPAPPAPHFTVHGDMRGGSLKIRYKMRLEEMFGLHD